MSAAAKLYSPEVLALAVELAQWPAKPDLPFHGEARSPTCGSVITMDAELDGSGALLAMGMRVRACAIGQAAAALFARSAIGLSRADLERTLAELEAWVAGTGPQPMWPGLELLAPALNFPARHGAVVLPWKAALAALEFSAAEAL